MTGDLSSGVNIDHEPERYLSIPNVTLRIVGHGNCVWLRPDEARKLAEYLIKHAKLAEGK